MDLKEFGYSGKWGALRLKYERRELRRPEIVALLRSDEPVTEEGKQLLADVISNEGKSLKSGALPKFGASKKGISRTMLVEGASEMLEDVTSYIAEPRLLDFMPDVHPDFRQRVVEAHKKTTFKRRQSITAYAQAKRWVAEFYGISDRTLSGWLLEAREHKEARKNR